MKLSKVLQSLLTAAREVRQHAYAPYSKFSVGAAIRLQDGRIFVGTNVENCSYGLTVCAERNAIAAAVAQGAKPGALAAVAIATKAKTLITPCGACRQVLAEFGQAQTKVILLNITNNQIRVIALGRLLPQAFAHDQLKK